MGRPPGTKVTQEYVKQVKETYRQRSYKSQQAFAVQLGISPETVKAFLNGKSISLENFQKISEALKLSWEELAGFKKPTFSQRNCNHLPAPSPFFGRINELATIKQWIIEERCQIIAITGMGGIGKTALSLKLAYELRGEFEHTIWHTLLNAPPLTEILPCLIKDLSNQVETNLPAELSTQVFRFMSHLRTHRCLIFLDNAETILQSSKYVSGYRNGYEGYGELLKQIGESLHQSCLVLNSREKPLDISFLESDTGLVRSLKLNGLSGRNGREFITSTRPLSGSDKDWEQLITLYKGNPLALKLTASHIESQFSASISNFLSADEHIFGNMQALLDQYFKQLSDLEKEIMYWLAINREPVSTVELREDFLSFSSQKKLSTALNSLQHRELLEKRDGKFILQPLLMEYITEKLVEEVCKEFENREAKRLNTHSLFKAQSKDYVREIQKRFILEPIYDNLLVTFESQGSLNTQLNQILSMLRENSLLSSGYAGGNILNLLCTTNSNLSGFDFSRLTIRQANLQGVTLHDVNCVQSKFIKCLFTQRFSSVFSVAVSPDRRLIAAGDTSGDIHLWQVEDGQHLQTFRGHTNWVMTVAFNPDGSMLASGSLDKAVRLWDVPTGQCLGIFQGHLGRVWSVSFHPNGKTLASGSDDQTIKIWDVDTLRCVSILRGHTHWVTSIAFSPDGKSLASGSSDSAIKIWDTKNNECLNTIQGHLGRVWSVSFHPNGKTLASGSDDQTIKIWDVQSGECLNTLVGHTNRIRSVAFSSDGRTLASGSEDQTIRVWDTLTVTA